MIRDGVESAARLGVVPALLVIGVLAAAVSAGQVLPNARAAAYGGFWAGALGFVAVVLGLRGVPLDGMPWWLEEVPPPAALVLGLGAGPLNTGLYLRFRESRLVAIPLGCQTIGALTLLYLFLVWPAVRDHVGWTAIGIAAASAAFYAFGRDRWPRTETSLRRRNKKQRKAHRATGRARRLRELVGRTAPTDPAAGDEQ